MTNQGPTYESADSNKPEEIIKATQKALIQAMRNIISDMKSDVKSPGLTWDQIDYFLETFGKKEPKVLSFPDDMGTPN